MGKYFKYAIGEILLVVIGILIALQINNWNENRKNYNTTKRYLTEILKDLEADTIIINRGKDFAVRFAENEKWALNKTAYSALDVNRLWTALGGFYAASPLNRRTFDKIQNSGESNLIGFDSLYDKIGFYYTKIHDRYESFYEYDKKVTLDRLALITDINDKVEISSSRMAYLGSETKVEAFPQVQDSVSQMNEFIAFIKSPRGRNLLKHNYIRHKRTIRIFDITKAEATALMTEIKEALN
jgi:hypothetical protein